MTTLRDGRFVFIHAERQYLLVEQAQQGGGNAAATSAAKGALMSPIPTQLLYGGTVYAFALNATQTCIALLCPVSNAAALSTATAESFNSASAVLRLFSFARGEVGELLGELVTVLARRVVWIGDRYIALDVQRNHSAQPASSSIPPSLTPAQAGTNATVAASTSSTILVEVTKSSHRLKLLREDKTSAAPVAGPGSILCDVCPAKQRLRLWDLQRNKTMGECQLLNRKCRHGKPRVAAATGSDGPFVFVVNDDWTVHGFYVGRNGTVHAPKPMLTQFESQSVNQAARSSSTTTAAKRKEECEAAVEDGSAESEAAEEQDAGKGSYTAKKDRSPHNLSLPTPQLHVCKVSETQVLLALTGSPTILQCAYDPKSKDAELKVVAKMRLPRRLQATAEVVGLAQTTCLVLQRESGENADEKGEGKGSSTYLLLPLEMKATGKAVVESAKSGESSVAKASNFAKEEVVCSGAMGVEAGAGAEEASEGKRKEKKKKNKKSAANVAAEAEESAPASLAKATVPASASPAAEGRSRAAGPTQRAVERLLVHVGITGKEQLPYAFASEVESKVGGARANAGEDSGRKLASPTAGPPNVGGPASPVQKGTWLSTDALVTAGGAVLGVVLGVAIVRKLSLL